MISASFDLHVASILPTKFPVNWPLDQEKKGKIDFQDGGHGRYFGFPIRMNLAIFDLDLQVTLILPTKFGVSRHRRVGGVVF